MAKRIGTVAWESVRLACEKVRSGPPLDTTRTALQARETLRGAPLEVVGNAEVDFAAFDRARQQHAARAGRNAGNACVAFCQADLVRHVRALQAELPVRPEVGD